MSSARMTATAKDGRRFDIPRAEAALRDYAVRFDASAIGGQAARYGLVLVLVWIGLMKFTEYEAEGIRPFVENSPPVSWLYRVLSVRGTATLIGLAELVTAALIAARPVSARAAAAGSAMAVGTFLTTLSFLVTTPGVWEPSEGGFPAASLVGQFVIKDFVLLGAALWSLGEAARNLGRR